MLQQAEKLEVLPYRQLSPHLRIVVYGSVR